jgi:hypothetical protein
VSFKIFSYSVVFSSKSGRSQIYGHIFKSTWWKLFQMRVLCTLTLISTFSFHNSWQHKPQKCQNMLRIKVLFVGFVRNCVSFSFFHFCDCIICPSFSASWLPHWYFPTVLKYAGISEYGTQVNKSSDNKSFVITAGSLLGFWWGSCCSIHSLCSVL